MKNIINNNGFSLMECLVAIIIISVVVLIWGFYGSDHVRIAISNEGRMFINQVVAQERLYLAEKSEFWVSTGIINDSDELNLNTIQNKYFKTFKVSTSTTGDTLIVEMYAEPGVADKIMVRGVFNSNISSNNQIDYYEFYDYVG